MTQVWQARDARNRLGEVIDRALRDGPQVVTRYGRPVVQVVALDAPVRAPMVRDDGFAAHLLAMPRAGTLQMPPRSGRRPPPELGS